MPPTRLKGVVENLDSEDSGRPRVLTKRGTDVGGFYDDDDQINGDVKTVSRSSTSSEFAQQKRLEDSRKVCCCNELYQIILIVGCLKKINIVFPHFSLTFPLLAFLQFLFTPLKGLILLRRYTICVLPFCALHV